jgi:hypothetical protein
VSGWLARALNRPARYARGGALPPYAGTPVGSVRVQLTEGHSVATPAEARAVLDAQADEDTRT